MFVCTAAADGGGWATVGAVSAHPHLPCSVVTRCRWAQGTRGGLQGPSLMRKGERSLCGLPLGPTSAQKHLQVPHGQCQVPAGHDVLQGAPAYGQEWTNTVYGIPSGTAFTKIKYFITNQLLSQTQILLWHRAELHGNFWDPLVHFSFLLSHFLAPPFSLNCFSIPASRGEK